MKLNKSEKKVLLAVRDKLEIEKGKHGRYPLNIQKATVLLMDKNLIHLCDENHWCISDLDRVNSLIGVAAQGESSS